MQYEIRYKVHDRILGRYEVYQIKEGGMGIVYLCYDHKSGIPCALKSFQDKYLASKIAKERFTEEALTWIKLGMHRNIVQAHRVENIEGKPYIFLEFIIGARGYGVDLRSWLLRGPIDLRNVLNFAIQICLGMEHARRQVSGFVHRDIKPENILINQDKVVKVSDFGLVKTLEANNSDAFSEAQDNDAVTSERSKFTRLGDIVGTLPYMSPEQRRGDAVDVRSDIYSFGCMLYEMLTGKMLFEGWKVRDFFAGRSKDEFVSLHKNLASFPTEINAIIAKCMNSNMTARYNKFLELGEALVKCHEVLIGKKPLILVDFRLAPGISSTRTVDTITEACDLQENFARAVSSGEILQSPSTWNNRGESFASLGRYDEAISCYDRALEVCRKLEVDSKYPSAKDKIIGGYTSAWVSKGNALSKLGRAQDTLYCYDQALSLDPICENAWYNKGELLFNSIGNAEEAIMCYRKALELDSHDDFAWNSLGFVLSEQGKLEEAMKCYDRALTINSRFVTAWGNKGRLLEVMGLHDEAIACCDRCLDINPGSEKVWAIKGEMLCAIGKIEEAISCFDRAIALDPFMENAWCNKGVAMAKLGRYDDALACFDSVLALNSHDETTWFNKGLTFVNMERIREALTCFEEAKRLGHSQVTEAIEWCRQELKQQ